MFGVVLLGAVAACDGLAVRAGRPRGAGPVRAGAATAGALAADAPACVVVPGFLYGAPDFVALAENLRALGVRATVAPIAWWHWLPCVGGRSVRPILERVDAAVGHARTAEDVALVAPWPRVGVVDFLGDLRDTPGGVLGAGGARAPDAFPVVAPRGDWPDYGASRPRPRCALAAHSAAGWIARIYLSARPYGGRAYGGADRVSRLVTLGSPHAAAPGAAFANVEWARREPPPVPALAVAGTGVSGAAGGAFTRDSYAFCGLAGDALDAADGDGVTPTTSALALDGARTLALPDTLHAPQFPRWLAAELHAAAETTPWFGDATRLAAWAPFLLEDP